MSKKPSDAERLEALQRQVDHLTQRIVEYQGYLNQAARAHNKLIVSHNSLVNEFGELAQKVLRLERANRDEEPPDWWGKFTGRN